MNLWDGHPSRSWPAMGMTRRAHADWAVRAGRELDFDSTQSRRVDVIGDDGLDQSGHLPRQRATITSSQRGIQVLFMTSNSPLTGRRISVQGWGFGSSPSAV